MSCPYPDEMLEEWDGVANPIGKYCNNCSNLDCEHNLDYGYVPEPEEIINFVTFTGG